MRGIKGCAAPPPFTSWADPSARDSNDKSRVILWLGFLLPGDSSQREEWRWAQEIRDLKSIHVLLLGHHGSRTATSALLLSKLPGLRMAVASARQRKYGHPHIEVEHRLRSRHIPLLRTEEWGHLHFEL